MYKYTSKIILLAVFFALFVVTLGAFTRLTDAGLGCPDWPGCYGKMVLPNSGKALVTAQSSFPSQPIEKHKAWTEMSHRYAAGTLGFFILFIVFNAMSAFRTDKPFPRIVPFVLLGLLIFQAALGMWTVTLKLLPIVVMGHLLGGFSILACLWWCYLSLNSNTADKNVASFKPWVVLGVVIVFCQIALGGWVSSNYAGLSCVGFPTCNGTLIPQLDMKNAFDIMSTVGINYQGGLLDTTSRITIQFVHRIGAMITFFYVFILSLLLIKKGNLKLKKAAMVSLFLVMVQFSLGVINVVRLLPLKVAVAHNGVAALLLLSMLTLVHHIWKKGGSNEC